MGVHAPGVQPELASIGHWISADGPPWISGSALMDLHGSVGLLSWKSMDQRVSFNGPPWISR
eukprot:364162-Chlamydomonas_euryale.AAC.5